MASKLKRRPPTDAAYLGGNSKRERYGGDRLWNSSRSSLAHAQASCCACCRTSRPVGCSRRTNYRHQHLIFTASNRFVAGYDAESCDARRSSFTLKPRVTFWSHRPGRSSNSFFARRTRIAFWPHRPARSSNSFFARRTRIAFWSHRSGRSSNSFFAWRSRLALRSLWA